MAMNVLSRLLDEVAASQLNPSKTEVYSTGMSQVELEEEHMITGFTLASLPSKISGEIDSERLCSFARKGCHEGQETRDHLFEESAYSRRIWQEILKLGKLNREPGTWRQQQVSNNGCKQN
ncbi:hypothetical protein J1N35_019796 [Gossypium stocksii]|uniref:Uncharacterized protein n=1 Tax=Gossypium stocksii TaxID=47602 RepID=A0A9D4A0E2_9ROSI|nr:hypothetical protein J1N35_019796 [Gossypium stocksii]